ncbi:MAG: hypothetical protein JO309_00425 [Pseudonocardiales bacterium]|nr:hypothetical protein [Pseudonocardiales bacterium]MBV9727886.1 hypothetical protein [Pseudonocardiales bacterium]
MIDVPETLPSHRERGRLQAEADSQPPDSGHVCPAWQTAGCAVSTAELGESLPEGVFHLLTADSDKFWELNRLSLMHNYWLGV